MKKVLDILLCMVIVASLQSCKLSTEQLANEVRKEMNKNFKSEGLDIKIIDLTLVHEDGNNYSGILQTKEDGVDFSYNVEVVYDGEYFKYEILE